MENTILDTYFRDHFYAFTKHHIDSYREFIRKYIPDVVKSYNPITMVKFHNNKEDDLELRVEVFIGLENGENIYVDRPTLNDTIMTPQDARLNNLTYSTNLYADILVRYEIAGRPTKIEKIFPFILLGKIPLMVHSDGCILHHQGPKVLQSFDECIYDQGGYFIIDGKEKVVISQERMVTNILFVEPAKDPYNTYRGWLRCTTERGETALLPKTIEFFIFNPPDDVKVLRKTVRGAIVVSTPNIYVDDLPLFALFRALGVESDKDILTHIFGDVKTIPQHYIDFIKPSIYDANNFKSQIDVIEYLKNNVRYKSTEYVNSILTNDIFPNMGTNYSHKARFLGIQIKNMIEMVLGVKPMINRDNYGYKRIDLSGFLLSQLFNNIYKYFRKNCRDLIDQEYHLGSYQNTGNYEEMIRKDNIQKLIQPSFITERMKRSLKGLWGSSENDEKQEKVQDLSRISYIGFLSNLRRVNTPLDRTIKIISPHRLNAQQWGIVCPFESPDGASIGYLKNLALLAHVSFGTNPDDLLNECFDDLEVIKLDYLQPLQGHTLTRVFLNGTWVGCVMYPDDFCYKMRLLRRNGLINVFTSVAWKMSNNEIRVHTDAGRGCRPLRIVGRHLPEKEMEWFDYIFGSLLPKEERTEELYYKSFYKSPFKLLKTKEVWKELEKTQSFIEFIDIEESDTMLIAMYEKDITPYTTHIEIDPSTILSVVTSNIPLSNHNFAARNIFYGAQSKQALGIYASNYTKRFDTTGYVLNYSQKALITTKNSHYNWNDKLPAGYNIIVAVATYSGYNQEDGVILNKNSIDRGLFHCTSYKSYSAEETTENKYDYTMITNPLELKKKLKIDIDNLKDPSIYQLLDEDGVAIPESFVTKGSKLAIVGMVHVKEELCEIQKGIKKETQLVKKYKDISMTTDIHHYGMIDKIHHTHKVCKVRFRKIRKPELGDKVCSRHGQKGVVGMIVPAEDMPFTKDGIVPDIIINPHAIPSRMTIGHLVECVFAKVCSLEGVIGDGSVFIPVDYEKLGSDLEKYKFEKNGNEILYNGKTGTQINTEIFIGPTYYLRLKHMVADKMHSRDKGPKDQLTRQPPSGRSNEGGLRIGEMERDVLLSYGFSQFSKESVMERSDKYTWAVCKCCGRTSSYNPSQAIYNCHACNTQDIAIIQTPFAYKLLTHELEAMGISPRLITDDIIFENQEDDIDEEDMEQHGGGIRYELENEVIHEGSENEEIQGGSENQESDEIQGGSENEDEEIQGGSENQESDEIQGGSENENEEIQEVSENENEEIQGGSENEEIQGGSENQEIQEVSENEDDEIQRGSKNQEIENEEIEYKTIEL
jgi:DNA-directed RNA polymerase II subunit RPB2